MAKFKCSECENIFENQLDYCPKCGCPIDYCERFVNLEETYEQNNKDLDGKKEYINIKEENEALKPIQINKKEKISNSKFTLDNIIYAMIIVGIATILFCIMAGLPFSCVLWFPLITVAIMVINNIVISYKYKRKLNQLDISDYELKKEKERRERILTGNTKEERNEIKKRNLEKEAKEKLEKKEINNKEQQIYLKWVENVKNNKIFKDKEYINIKDVGLLWYENETYHLYMVNLDFHKFKLGYEDGVISSKSISVSSDIHLEIIHHNGTSKFKGAMIGAIVAGPTGAIVGQNYEKEAYDETYEQESEYYLNIDDVTFIINEEDYLFLKEYISKNKKRDE